jgi:hypothetical protein
MRAKSNGRLRRRATKSWRERRARKSLSRSDAFHNFTLSMRNLARLLFPAAFAFASCATNPNFPADLPPTKASYKKVIEDQVGRNWYDIIGREPKELLEIGTVSVTFAVAATGGRPVIARVTLTKPNLILDRKIAITAVNRLRLPPIPEPLLRTLPERKFVMQETFTVFDQPPSSSPANHPTAQP